MLPLYLHSATIAVDAYAKIAIVACANIAAVACASTAAATTVRYTEWQRRVQ
jgi:hypothetical protein